MSQNLAPFARVTFRNDPLLVGAQWWQDSLATAANPVARRELLIALGGITTVVGVGVACAMFSGSSSSSYSNLEDDEQVNVRESIDVQREQGWSFGTTTDPLTFDGESYAAFDRASLDTLATDMTPSTKAYQPFYIQTLLQAVSAKPSAAGGPVEPVGPLRDALRPISTPTMTQAYGQGKSLGSLFEGAPPGKAVLVDMAGPEAVAFAAGLAEFLDPVLLFDNWPHPRGVVPSHLTLAALAYYAPLFKKAASKRKPGAPAAFILDKNRLNPYADDSDRFDNRYMAKLPSTASLRTLGVTQLLYVGTNPESDDLNSDFVTINTAGIATKTVETNDFVVGPTPPPAPPAKGVDAGVPSSEPSYYYGGSSDYHYFFWSDYGWGHPYRPTRGPRPGSLSAASSYGAPVARSTLFSSTPGGPRTAPANFGKTSVIVNRTTGRVVGSTFLRSGSFGRSSGSWGG